MAKVNIIHSYSLESLKREMIGKIDHANIEADVYRQEFERQKNSAQKESILLATAEHRRHWEDRATILHEALCDIEHFVTEIDI